MSRTAKPSNAISYQVSIRGRGLAQLSHDALAEMVERQLDGTPPPDGVEVKIQCWRAGREIEMDVNNSRATTLREVFRRLLQEGAIALEVRHRSEDDE
jgi:hypothetical protein